ncbi:MAG: hypothetical protein Q8934_19245 [Bacillota bacterium]|nr:hypothetical protein [Bacillota bacterium]
MSMISSVELLPEEVPGEHFNLVNEEGVTIHYIRKGEGTPVVLLHG